MDSEVPDIEPEKERRGEPIRIAIPIDDPVSKTPKVEEVEAVEDRDFVESVVEFDATAAISELRRRQQRVERITFMLTWVFIITVGIAIFLTGAGGIQGAGQLIQGIEKVGKGSGGIPSTVNCADERFRNSSMCKNRVGDNEADWRAIERRPEGSGNAFSLHGRE